MRGSIAILTLTLSALGACGDDSSAAPGDGAADGSAAGSDGSDGAGTDGGPDTAAGDGDGDGDDSAAGDNRNDSGDGTIFDSLIPELADCFQDEECGSGETCFIDVSGQKRTCRTACPEEAVGGDDGDDGGVPDPCGAGNMCTSGIGLSDAACLKTCEPFSSPSPCDDGDWCYPLPSSSFTGGVQVEGLCVAGSNLRHGDPCDGGGCGPDLICRNPLLATIGRFYCEPACDLDASPGEPGSCADEERCVPDLRSGGGACVQDCELFTDDHGCPGTEACMPFEENVAPAGSAIERQVQGHCVRPGSIEEGEPCIGAALCAAGMACTQEPLPCHHEPPVCRRLCDPGDESACGDGHCQSIWNGEQLAIGTCMDRCDPWASDDGCPPGQWCTPGYLDAEHGTCFEPVIEVQAGGLCESQLECSAGTFCSCRFGNDDLLSCSITDEARCATVCDPDAAAGEPGSCPEGEACAPQPFANAWSAFGLCRPGCDFDGAVPCDDPQETCVPGELTAQGVDTCYDIPQPYERIGGSCSIRDLQSLDFCGPTAACIDVTGFFQCEDLCRVSAGALGTTAHPDCADPLSECTQFDSDLPYGFCR